MVCSLFSVLSCIFYISSSILLKTPRALGIRNWKGNRLVQPLNLAEDTEALMGTGGGPGQTPEFHSQGELSTSAHENQEKRKVASVRPSRKATESPAAWPIVCLPYWDGKGLSRNHSKNHNLLGT